MKKKFLVIMTAVIMALMCVVGLVACTDDEDGLNGTYYAYYDGVKDPGITMVLKDGVLNVTFSEKERTETYSGTYTVDGDTIEMVLNQGGKIDDERLTIVSDGILKVSGSYDGLYYCKDGKTPPAKEKTEE